MKTVTAVHGDKGGVGKTFTAQLTAAAFLNTGTAIKLIDGDAKNPGLWRYFNGKPDEVLRINARRPEGIDELVEAILGAPGGVVVDLPAGGSETTAGFIGSGTSAGSVDLLSLLEEIDARLTVLFVLDGGRDGIVALSDEVRRLPAEAVDWIIVRNHRTNPSFDRLDRWLERPGLPNFTVLDMPELDRRVTEALVDAKAHIGEIDAVPAATALMKMRAKSALRIWTGELHKAGLLNA